MNGSFQLASPPLGSIDCSKIKLLRVSYIPATCEQCDIGNVLWVRQSIGLMTGVRLNRIRIFFEISPLIGISILV
jgi:hypothetical protein